MKKHNLWFPQLFYVISLVSILLTMGTGFSFAQNVQNEKTSKDIQNQTIWDKKEWKEWKEWKESVEKVENKWEKNETQESWDTKTLTVDENSKIEEKIKTLKHNKQQLMILQQIFHKHQKIRMKLLKIF